MLIFIPLGGLSLRVTGAEKPMVVFPGAKPTDEEVISLLGNPEEENSPGAISWPGEYNVGGASIRGIAHREGQQSSYVAEIDGVRIAFLSSPLQDWTDHDLEFVGDIDVLVLPTDDAKLAQKLLDEFDPRALILLPSHDHANVVKSIAAGALSVEEYKLKGKSSLPAEGREVVVLTK